MRRLLSKIATVTSLAGLAVAGTPARAVDQASFVPEWSRGVVWYEIAPESFRNGDPANDPTAEDQKKYFPDLPAGWRVHPWTSDWYALSEDEKANGKGLAFNLPRRRYGGDLQGIIDRLDYLRDLGIGGIYLMPIFDSRSSHKYAYGDPRKKTELSWKSFMGETIYAELRKDQQAPNDYIFASTARWTRPVIDGVVREGVDGWRLDVADFIPHEFWKDWSARVRSLNPQAFLMGECAKPFSQVAPYVHPGGFSSVMSYGFKALVEQFFVSRRLKASRFDAQLAKLRGVFPEEANLAMYNLLDSHDTERLSSLIVNPDALKLGDARDFGNPELNGTTPDFDTRKPNAAEYRLLELVAIFQMTYLGAPAILYGDEVGMWAAGRNFKPMVWSDLAHASEAYTYDAGNAPDGNRKVRNDRVQVVKEVHEHFRKLIRLRRTHPALRAGGLETLIADDARELLAYARRAGDETIVVIINNGTRPQVVELESATGVRELLDGDATYPSRDGRVQVPVGAGWGAVLLKQ